MEPVLSKKNLFLKNPYINPDTNENVVIGSKEYKQLVKKYGEPHKIKSPKSNKLIGVNKGEYKNLIKSGYTDTQLFNLPKQANMTYTIKNINYTENELITMIDFYNQHHISNELPKELWEEILLQTDIKDLKQACITNKITNSICHNNQFWKTFILKHQLPFEWIDLSQIKIISDWIQVIEKLYFSIHYAKTLSNLLIYLHKNYPGEIFDLMTYSKTIGHMDKVLIKDKQGLINMQKTYDELNEQDDSQYTLHFRYEDDEYSFNYALNDENGDDVDGFEDDLTKEEFVHILSRWLFFIYNKDNDLFDMDGFSYFYDPLLKTMNKNFTTKSDYQQRQYKILKLRLDYLKQHQ